jgi:hypothetical protein
MQSSDILLMMLLLDISDVISLAEFIANARLLSNSMRRMGLR